MSFLRGWFFEQTPRVASRMRADWRRPCSTLSESAVLGERAEDVDTGLDALRRGDRHELLLAGHVAGRPDVLDRRPHVLVLLDTVALGQRAAELLGQVGLVLDLDVEERRRDR